MPLRSMPKVGGAVVVNFLGSTVSATVRSVSEDGRRLEVMTEDGETLVFALNRATATFTAEGHQTGARLTFID
jgi:phage gp45-like